MQAGMETRDVWSTAYVNALPDSAFLLVVTDAGGNKQRLFPYRDANGKIDLPHLKNAGARIPQASTLTADQRAAAMAKYKKAAAAHPGIGEGTTKTYQGSAGSGRSKPPTESPVLTRTYDVALELRTDGDGRTLHGRAVPYDQTADVDGGRNRERFVMGAFARQIAGGPDVLQRVKMFPSHTAAMARGFGVGKTVHLVERPDGLHGAWRLYDTPAGDEALHMVRTGEVTGLSIGFKPVDGGTRKAADGAYEQHAAHLDHIVLTGEPAYAGAQVTAVRSVVHPAAAYRTELIRARHLLERVRS
jgi:hypothetical protein